MTKRQIVVEWLDECASTQDLALQRLAGQQRPRVHAIAAQRQLDGRGRAQRRWENPPGTALLLSVAIAGPLDVACLEGLPRAAAHVLLEELETGERLEWKAPNDLIAAGSAHKVAGVLVDARTTAGCVEHVVVGIGANLTGPEFVTRDGRMATSVEALVGHVADAPQLAHRIALRLRDLVVTARS